MTAQEVYAQRSLRSEYSTISMANDVRNRLIGYTIVLGDNGKFWILPNRHASILVKAGYEYAE